MIIPRPDQLQQQSGLTLEIHTSSHNEDLLAAAIRFGCPPWPQHDAYKLVDASTALVASPDYFQRYPINKRRDWQHQCLIHARRHSNDWQRVEQQQVFSRKPRKQLYFNSYDSAVQAAIHGLGILIATFPISTPELQSGRLQARSQQRYACEEGFYLVTKPNDHKAKHYQRLQHWLRDLFQQLST